MLLDVSRALRAPGEEFAFVHSERVPPQEIFGETVTFDDPVMLSGKFALTGQTLSLRGTLRTVAHAKCANCLKDVEYPVVVPFDEAFLRVEDNGRQTEDNDTERLVFEGYRVELSQLALTLAVLDLPIRFLCGPDCQGLMRHNPSLNPSDCQKEAQDERPFSALRNMLTKDQEV